MILWINPRKGLWKKKWKNYLWETTNKTSIILRLPAGQRLVTNDMEKWNLLVNSKRIKRPNKLMFLKESLRQYLNTWFRRFLQDSLIVTSMQSYCNEMRMRIEVAASSFWHYQKTDCGAIWNTQTWTAMLPSLEDSWHCAHEYKATAKPVRDNKMNESQRHLRYLIDVTKYTSPIQAFETWTLCIGVWEIAISQRQKIAMC